MHGSAATGTVGVFRRDRHVDMRQGGGEARRDWCSASRRACVPLPGRSYPRRPSPAAVARTSGRMAEWRALRPKQQMPQAIHLRQRPVTLGGRSGALRPRGRDQRLQCPDICRKLICDLSAWDPATIRPSSFQQRRRPTPTWISSGGVAPKLQLNGRACTRTDLCEMVRMLQSSRRQGGRPLLP